MCTTHAVGRGRRRGVGHLEGPAVQSPRPGVAVVVRTAQLIAVQSTRELGSSARIQSTVASRTLGRQADRDRARDATSAPLERDLGRTLFPNKGKTTESTRWCTSRSRSRYFVLTRSGGKDGHNNDSGRAQQAGPQPSDEGVQKCRRCTRDIHGRFGGDQGKNVSMRVWGGGEGPFLEAGTALHGATAGGNRRKVRFLGPHGPSPRGQRRSVEHASREELQTLPREAWPKGRFYT